MSENERAPENRARPGTATTASGLAALPARPAGSLTNDLASDTDDLATLRQRLDRARERLAFYESFDRIIQENIRRSSELMIEATELHERAERAIAVQAEAQAALDQQRADDRAHYATLLSDLQNELGRTRAALDGITARVTSALAGPAADTVATPDESATASAESTAAPAPASIGGAPAVPPASITADVGAASALAPQSPRTVEVLVHGVPTARVAISFQNHLRGLDQVSEVEAREFVEGLLRLQVTATGDLGTNELAGWSDGDGAETLRALPDLLEISLPGTTER